MDWRPFMSYWIALLGASGYAEAWWAWPGAPITAPPVAEAAPAALDLDLIQILYEVLTERADCAICGASLDPTVKVQPARGQVFVGTRCRGWRRHRHLATVVERAGELRLGQLGVTHSR